MANGEANHGHETKGRAMKVYGLEHMAASKRRCAIDAERALGAARRKHAETGAAMALVMLAARRLQTARAQAVNMTKLVAKMREKGGK